MSAKVRLSDGHDKFLLITRGEISQSMKIRSLAHIIFATLLNWRQDGEAIRVWLTWLRGQQENIHMKAHLNLVRPIFFFPDYFYNYCGTH